MGEVKSSGGVIEVNAITALGMTGGVDGSTKCEQFVALIAT